MREIPKTISKRTIDDQIASLFYALGLIKDDEDVISIKYGDMNKDQVKLIIKVKPRGRRSLIIHE